MKAVHSERIHELVLSRGAAVTCFCPIDMDHNMDDLGELPNITDEPQTIDRDALIADLNFSRFMSLPDRADRIFALLRPDPRIAQIEALLADVDEWNAVAERDYWRNITTDQLRAILRGDQ